MTDLSSFAEDANPQSAIDDILNSSSWEPLPDKWSAWQTQNPSQAMQSGEDILLFRIHKYHTNPDLRQIEQDGIVHASPALATPGAIRIKDYNSAPHYGGSERFAFVTVYRANEEQTFYYDEGLENEGAKGTPIQDIEKFSPNISGGAHFETDARSCEVIGVYCLTLPPDPNGISKPKPILESARRVIRIDNNPEILSALNSILGISEKTTSTPTTNYDNDTI